MEREGGRDRRQLNFSCQFYLPTPSSSHILYCEPKFGSYVSLLYAVHRGKGYGDRKGSWIHQIDMQFEIEINNFLTKMCERPTNTLPLEFVLNWCKKSLLKCLLNVPSEICFPPIPSSRSWFQAIRVGRGREGDYLDIPLSPARIPNLGIHCECAPVDERRKIVASWLDITRGLFSGGNCSYTHEGEKEDVLL